MKIYFLFYLLLILGCCNKQHNINKFLPANSTGSFIDEDNSNLVDSTSIINLYNNIYKIEIDYVDITTETCFSIPCDRFADSFISNKKKIIITDSQILQKIENVIISIQKKKILEREIDTRIQMKIYKKGGQVDIVCIDYIAVVRSPKLYQLLKSLNVIFQ